MNPCGYSRESNQPTKPLIELAMIHCSQVNKEYCCGSVKISAISNLNVEVSAGQRVAVLGRSGSGKSTLLNLLAALDRPTSGQLTIAGQRLDQLSRSNMATFRLRSIGIIFQAFQLVPQRTACENIELPLILMGKSRSVRKQIVGEMLERVGLVNRKNHFPFQLSGGEQQRVAIARAIVHGPKLILADEPTGNLDLATSDSIIELLMELFREKAITVVLVTHDPSLAERICNRVLTMADGKLQDLENGKGMRHVVD